MPKRLIPILRRAPSETIVIRATDDWEAWDELTFLIKSSEKFGSTSKDVPVRRRAA
jgi:hypothetical protein